MSLRYVPDYSMFDRRDPSTGRYRCRNCGKPSVPPKIFYCSDECRRNFGRCISWEVTRREVWERDRRKCRICQGEVNLYDDGWIERPDGRWRRATDEERKENSKKLGYECHHIVEIPRLRYLAWKAVIDLEDREPRSKRYTIAYTFLYLDKENLLTLCLECHKKVHKSRWKKRRKPQGADYTKYLRRWRAFITLNKWNFQTSLLTYFKRRNTKTL